jgi:hypothetical protein
MTVVEYEAARGYFLRVLKAGLSKRAQYDALDLAFEDQRAYFTSVCPPVTPAWPNQGATS